MGVTRVTPVSLAISVPSFAANLIFYLISHVLPRVQPLCHFTGAFYLLWAKTASRDSTPRKYLLAIFLSSPLSYMEGQVAIQSTNGKSRVEISGADPLPRDGSHHRESQGTRKVREDG